MIYKIQFVNEDQWLNSEYCPKPYIYWIWFSRSTKNLYYSLHKWTTLKLGLAQKQIKCIFHVWHYTDVSFYLTDVNIKESNKHRAPAFTFGNRCVYIYSWSVKKSCKRTICNQQSKILILFCRQERKLNSNSPAPNAYNTSRLNPRGMCYVMYDLALIICR